MKTFLDTTSAEGGAPVLLPTLIDSIAATQGQDIYAEYLVDSNNNDADLKQITYAQLANAINGVAHLLEKEFGRGMKCEPIVYLGPSDARYVFAMLGAIKAGYTLFLTSPRNSMEAHLSMLGSLNCTKMVAAEPRPLSVADILAAKDMQLLTIAGFEELLNGTWKPYPYNKTLDEARHEGVFISHTSGSTGIPKTCAYNHEFLLRAARNTILTPPKGYKSMFSMMGHNRSVVLLPLFHPAGVQFALINALYNRTTVILPSASTPATIQGVVTILKKTKADWAIMAPFTFEALAKDEKILEQVTSHLKMLAVGGGALPQPLGDIISKRVHLLNCIGSSETAAYPAIYPEGFNFTRDWNYVQIHPAAGVEFEQRSSDGFELVVKRSPIAELYQPVFAAYPELTEYKTKDLFTPHPTWHNMWAHASRSDDIIVFLNGEKTNPVSFESQLSKHPDVDTVIVFGEQRFEAGILLELKEKKRLSNHERAKLIDRLWLTIEKANQAAPKHAQISASHILFTDPEHPIQRTAKHTIMRRATLAQYAEKIDNLYNDVEEAWAMVSSSRSCEVDLNNQKLVEDVIQVALQDVTNIKDLKLNDDLFKRGVDSLQVLRIVRNLKMRLGVYQLQPKTVYLNSTPTKLASAILDLGQYTERVKAEQEHARQARITDTLDAYLSRIEEQAHILPSSQRLSDENSPMLSNDRVVILTGSTGSIGSYILRALLERSDISEIYCLNRSPESAKKQIARNLETDPMLPKSFPGRVKFLEADLSHGTFNLDLDHFGYLSTAASLIIHNAWPVDFNLPLSSFTRQLDGVANLCSFAAACDQRPSVLFISSISAVMNTALRQPNVPEAIIEDVSASAAAGYAESKYIAERIFAHAAGKLRLNVQILRIGQVCGAVRSPGRWNPVEWIPSLIRGSRLIGVVPDSLGAYDKDAQDVDWIPIDILADAIVEIGSQKDVPQGRRGELEVLHLMNPRRTSWTDLVPGIIEALNVLDTEADGRTQGDHVPIRNTSPAEWVEKLRASTVEASSPEEAEKLLSANPALKLLDFYQSRLGETRFPHWDMEKAEAAASDALRDIESITRQDMERWVRAWCSSSM